ncbi:DNA repair protein rad18 [Cryptococcus deuterogattii MMRL2647]|nr:DNA repair protein rad18 [Cryptococcus deuterogattii MMRL2647]
MDKSHPLLANFDDPPPFPETHPQLRRLDRSVVCQICKEPFTAPVSIACGHSFCSHCIRSSLDVQKKCPSCNEPASEGSIRRNRALEEIAEAWEQSRPTLIDLSKPVSRKRAAPDADSRPSSSGTIKRLKDQDEKRSQSPALVEPIDSEEEDEIQELTENDEAPCPICMARMPISSIPMHVERGCPPPPKTIKASAGGGKGNQKADWKKVFSGQTLSASKGKESCKGREPEMKKITKPNYSLATPADLRALLSQYSLPTSGDKVTLIARVQEWIILYNANLDTSRPSSLSALRAKLAEAEASRKRDKEKGKDDLVEQLGSKDGLAKYAQEKRSEFERLRKEIMERDKRRKAEGKGSGRDSAIEVD